MCLHWLEFTTLDRSITMNMHLIILAEIGISSTLWFAAMCLDIATDYKIMTRIQLRMLKQYSQ